MHSKMFESVPMDAPKMFDLRIMNAFKMFESVFVDAPKMFDLRIIDAFKMDDFWTWRHPE